MCSWASLALCLPLPLPPTASPSLAASHAHKAMCKAAEEQKLMGFPQGKPKSGIKEYKGCICITLHMNCRGDAVGTILFPLSDTFITPPCRHKHLTFPKAQPKTQLQPALAWGIDTASHQACATCQEWSLALRFFAPEMRKQREDTIMRKDTVFHADWKQRGKLHSQTLQGRVSPREVLLFGSVSRHLLCSPFFWERAFKQDLGSKCAGALCAGFPVFHKDQQQCLGNHTPMGGSSTSEQTKGFGGCLEGPQSVCILRFGSLRKVAAWQESPADFTKYPAELQNQQQMQCQSWCTGGCSAS